MIYVKVASSSGCRSMGDLFDQARILAIMFESTYESNPMMPMSYPLLRSERYLKSMDAVGRLGPMLRYLHETGYVEGDNYHIWLTGKGMSTTISIFRKFLDFIKRYYPERLSQWINTLARIKGTKRELIRDSYFFIKNERPMEEAFQHYLDEIDVIENVETFEVDVYLNLDDINRLFENRFRCKLFLPPVAAQTMLNRSTRGKEIKFIEFVATLGSVIGGIYDSDINRLLGSPPHESGSISKIKSLLDKEKISYDAKTIESLRTLYRLRSTLEKLNITYPIDDFKEAATKMLQSLNSCLLEMKLWFK